MKEVKERTRPSIAAIQTTQNGLQKKIPTLSELVETSEQDLKDNALMVLLNQEPPKAWLQKHPMTGGDYLPIERVEYLLTRIYGKWWTEVKEVKVLANSVTVVVRLYVTNPLTKSEEWNDGIGACAIQTDKGAGAMDWNAAKSDGVMKAAPAAESYAIKDAAEKFGKLFGKDLTRKNQISYNNLLKTPVNKEEERVAQLIKNAASKTELNGYRKECTSDYLVELFATRMSELEVKI